MTYKSIGRSGQLAAWTKADDESTEMATSA